MRGGTIKSAKSYMAEAVNIDFISKASIIEQASMSGGTFLFFLFAARAAGSEWKWHAGVACSDHYVNAE